MKPLELTPDGKLKARIFLGMESPADLLAELERMRYLAQFSMDQAHRAVRGRRVKIVHEWHDQPIGRSRPNLIGKEYIVSGANVDPADNIRIGVAVSLWLEGLSCAIPVEYVEILP